MNSTIVITGCSSGIGLHAARALKARGHRVLACARAQADCERLQNEEHLESVHLDLDDSTSIRTAVDELLQRSDHTIDVLFNNAAYGQMGAVEDLTRTALREQFETNLFGTVELTNGLIPAMRRRGKGRIIQNSSVLGMVGMPYRGAYVASKFALEGLSDVLRQELRGSGIDVIVIEPGPILSRFRANAYAAFHRHITVDGSPHAATYRRMDEKLQREGAVVPFTLGPEAVTKRVIHAVENPRPKARYYVTVPTFAFGVLRRLLSTRALDALLTRVG